MLKLNENIFKFKYFNSLFLIFILIITFFSYSRVIGFDFIDWDDYIYILNNPLITDISWGNFKQLFYYERQISLVLFSFSIEHYFFGYEPWIYHLNNIILHLLNVILIYILCKKLGLNGAGLLLTVILFALHPMRVESIAWVMQRKDLFFSFFYLSGWLLYIYYIKKGEKNLFLILLVFLMGYLSYLSKIQSVVYPFILILTDIFFGIRFSFKNIFEKIFLLFILLTGQFDKFGWMTLILLFCFIFIYHFYTIKRSPPFIFRRNITNPLSLDLKNLFKRYFVLLILIIFFFGITIFTQIKYFKTSYIFILIYLILLFTNKYSTELKKGVYRRSVLISIIVTAGIILFALIFYNKSFIPLFSRIDTGEYSILQRLILGSFSFAYYVIKVFFPFNLDSVVLYPLNKGFDFPIIYYFSIIVPVLFTIFCLYFYKRMEKHRTSILFGILFFLFNIILVLHLFPIGGRVVVANRYTYMAYFGLFYLGGYLLMHYSNRFKAIQTLIILVFLSIFLSINNYLISGTWENTKTFWLSAIDKNPRNFYAWEGIGTIYSIEGNFEEAFNAYNISASTNPESNTVFNNRGVLKLNTGDYEGAIEDFNTSIQNKNKKGGVLRKNKVYDDITQVFFNRGNAYLMLKEFEKALDDYNAAIGKSTNEWTYYTNRSLVKMLLNDTAGAEQDINNALIRNPNDAVALYNRGLINTGKNKINEAHYDIALSKSIEKDVESLFIQIGLLKDTTSTVQTERNPYKSNEYIESGIKKARSGEFEAALKDFDISIALDSTNGYGYRNRCNLKYDMKNYMAAIDDCNKAIELMPNDITSYFIRAKVFNMLGNIPSACIDWKKGASMGDKNAEEMYSLRCKKK